MVYYVRWGLCHAFTANKGKKQNKGAETFVPGEDKDVLEMIALDNLVFREVFQPNRRRVCFRVHQNLLFDRLILRTCLS